MDPQTVLIGIAIFVISAILIYLIAAITMREKTFEEVMAEQKKRQEEEREKIKNDKKIEKELMKKKYKKGKGDKSKEKSAQVSEPELKDSPKAQEKEHKMVNLEIEPEIIEPAESTVLTSPSKPRNRMNAQKKSILHNKDEVTPVTEKTVELPHKPIKPLDDVELKKLHETQQASPKKEKSGQSQAELRHDTKEAVKEVKAQKVKTPVVETMEIQHGAAVEEKKITKSKSSTVVETSPGAVSGARLIDMVRSTSLSDQDLQTLIDILLNRQGAAAAATQEAWNKKSQKGDPMALMKRQLEEKERALQEEQQLAMASNNRVKELRNEVTAERTKLSALEKHYQDKMAEFEALQARMRHAHEQHMVETAKLQAHIQQLEKSGDAAMVQKLKQENRILQDSLSKASMETVSAADVNNLRQKVSIMETELSSNVVRLNSAEKAKKACEDKLKKYEDQIKKMESSKSTEESLAKKLEEAKEELRKSESKNGGLSADLKKTTAALTTMESESTMLKLKLQDLEKQLSTSESFGTKMQEAERKKQEMEGNMKNLEKQLADAVQRREDVTRQLQDSDRKKQEMDGNMKNLEKQLADSVQRQNEIGAELQRLQQENCTLTQEVKTTKERLQTMEAAPPATTNGDIHSEASLKDVIQITEHERILSEKVATVQSELEVQQRSSQTQITDLKTQLDTQKQKNNELREKNWKAMEALEKAEKSAAEKVDKSLKSSRENVTKAVSEVEKSDREILKRLFPAVSVSDKLGHKEWLASFEKQAVCQLTQSSKSEHSEKSHIDELEKENKKLQQQSGNYEKELKQLRADRDRLQTVEEENQRLKSSLSSCSAATDEVSQLQAENQELQSRLAEKDNSIAEAERKLHNLEHVVETEEKKWKEKLRLAEEKDGKGSESSDREQELEQLTIEQQSQIEHYRNVLMSTESVLQRLESAEKGWEEKVQTSQADLQKARSDCERIQVELQAAATDNTQLKREMESVRQELQQSSESLQVITREKEQLTSKVIVLETESKAIVQVDNEDLKKKMEEYEHQLEKEQKKCKDLSSTVVRLNGIIKTGQDALTQEQKLVQQLQEQLSDKTKGSGGSTSQELQQLRRELREKEKLLERERTAVKQLKRQLGQLGVMGTTAGNDMGTSV
ncbi:uncharacterized protein LOC143296517 isoform X3 [Babylonia areolata]|uniref:uncharacterized protein LOC143296517 isoform X3 n=1 Tax=Babylonia areolata TaxID=304850 RepID=UPI003FD472E9